MAQQSAFAKWSESLSEGDRTLLHNWVYTVEKFALVDAEFAFKQASSEYPNPPVPPVSPDGPDDTPGLRLLYQFGEKMAEMNAQVPKFATSEQVAAGTGAEYDKYEGSEAVRSPILLRASPSPPMRIDAVRLVYAKLQDGDTGFAVEVAHYGDEFSSREPVTARPGAL